MLRARNRQGFGWARWSRGWLYQTLKLFNGYQVVRPAPKAPGRIGPIILRRSKQETAVREIRMLRSTRRGLENVARTDDGVTLADERASQQGTQTSA